ncbi:MAG: class I SAM-dependent methyltransferase [Pseudomonadota bacterium]
MQAKLQRRIQRYGWDKAVDHYDNGWRESLRDAQERLLDLAAAQPKEHVLDIASGTGLVTFPLADAVSRSGRVVATDISQKMVDYVSRQASQRGYTQIDAFRADAESLGDLEDGQFDLITCALGLMYVPEPLEAMKHVTRLLKPGGRAVFAVWGARKNCGWADIFPIVDARVETDVCPMFFRLGTGSVMAMEMEQAGLQAIDEIRFQTNLPYASDEAAIEAAFIGGPVALAYDRFDPDTRASAHSEYLNSIAPFRSAGGYQIPGEFVICRGERPA